MKKLFLIFMIAIFVLSTNVFAGQKFCEGELKDGSRHLADWKATVSWSGGEDDVSNCWIHSYGKVWNPSTTVNYGWVEVCGYKVNWYRQPSQMFVYEGYIQTRNMFSQTQSFPYSKVKDGEAKLGKSAYTGSNGEDGEYGSSKKKYGKVKVSVQTHGHNSDSATCKKSFSYTK